MEVFTTVLEIFFELIITFWSLFKSIEFNITNHGNVIENENMTTNENKPMQIEF